MGIRLGAAVAALALVTGCANKATPSGHAEISKAEWRNTSNSGSWPFTVDQGVLTCRAPDWVTFTAGGTEYALSDTAS
jgi:hypothetical protein